MNRTKYFGLSLLILLCCLAATAQTTVTKCEYWIDQQFDSRTTVTMTGNTWNSSIDISALKVGLHTVAFRVLDNNGMFSSALVKNFLLVPGTGTGDNSLKTYEYWIDQQFNERKSGTVPVSGVISINEDISALKAGLHAIAMRVIDKNGIVSSVIVKNFLLVPGTGTGDNSLKTYEYWIDQKFSEKKSGTVPDGGIINIDEDVSALKMGLHTIAMRVIDKNGIVSSVIVKNFMLLEGAGTGDNSLKTYEYWFDQKFSEKKSGTVPDGGIININEDITALDNGLHTIAMRVIDKNGKVSSVLVKNFMKLERLDGDNSLKTYEYWIDGNFDERESATVPSDGIVNLNLDIASLAQGIHTFYYLTRDKAGLASAVVSKMFFVKKQVQEGKLIGIDYWFNDSPRTRIAIDPAQASINRNDILIPLDGIQPSNISEDYVFDVATKKVITKETVTVGIQVFNYAEIGSEAVVETLENMSFTVDPLFVPLTNEASDTKTAPQDGQVQGFSYAGVVGDSLHWEITGSDAKVDFFDADGNPITPETKTIDGNDVLVIKMPTTAVYLLTYGATEAGEMTVKVAQPIELTVADATREYGEENPTFTYTSKGAALAGEVTFTTEADVTSPVGDYVVSINGSGITNSYVTLKPGKLTITKAPLSVGVEDCSITEGESLPTFTLTFDGFKNNEDESVLTTLPVVTTDATETSTPGEYVLVVSGGEATNYELTYTNGTLTIIHGTGITGIRIDKPVNVYTVGGVLVRSNVTSLEGLPDGVYIINRKKVMIKRKK